MRDQIVLYVNGARREVDADAALLTLSTFLRSSPHPPEDARLTGTKIACSEGDCGACTVLVGELSEDGQSLRYAPVDACIAFVFQMDLRHVVTIEGLRQIDDLSCVQQAMVDCHGSQCGFCTPGFVMALHGLIEERRADQSALNEDAVRVGLSGNLCRCTGYLQILEAAASLGSPGATPLSEVFDEPAMLRDLGRLRQDSVYSEAADARVVAIPRSLRDLVELRAKLPDARLVAGATDLGVQCNHGRFAPKQVLCTRDTAELRGVSIEQDELIVGAAATWREIDHCLRDRLPELHEILLRFGSPQVRCVGTLAGNLANASPIADSIPFHFVAESTMELASRRGTRTVAVQDFYQGYKQIDLEDDEVIAVVRSPLPSPDVAMKLYKVTKRRDMDISTVTAAFWLRLEGDRIAEARIAMGGVGPAVLRLPACESLLEGNVLSLDAMRRAGKTARGEVAPISDVRGSSDYRLQLVENLFAKCYHDLTSNLGAPVS